MLKEGELVGTFNLFRQEDAAMGQTYEVWFIHDHFLFEVSTYKELEPGLNQILATWRFAK
jgi:hypothetical protein